MKKYLLFVVAVVLAVSSAFADAFAGGKQLKWMRIFLAK